jgi:tetratricopeptide (TPR) repeat protein
VLAIAGLSTPAAAFAQYEEYTAIMNKGAEFDRAGNFAEALSNYQAGIRIAERGPDIRTLASTVNATGLVYDELGRPNDAIRHYRRALNLLEQLKDNDSLEYAVVLGNLGSDMIEQGQEQAAEKVLRQAIAIGSAKTAPDDYRLAIMRTALAQAAVNTGRTKEAVVFLEDAIAVMRKHPERTNQLAIAINNLGVIRRLQKRCQEAAGLFEEAIRMTEREFGADHPRLLQLLNNLALAYFDVGRQEDAGRAMQRALQIAEVRLEPRHPGYGTVMLNYSRLLQKSGHKAEGKQMESRARALLKEASRTNGDGMTVDVTAFRK